jgi:hypothetical protein
MNADEQQDGIANASTESSQFDQYGRCVPKDIEAAAYMESRRYFSLVQPEITYQEIYARLNASFDIGSLISD